MYNDTDVRIHAISERSDEKAVRTSANLARSLTIFVPSRSSSIRICGFLFRLMVMISTTSWRVSLTCLIQLLHGPLSLKSLLLRWCLFLKSEERLDAVLDRLVEAVRANRLGQAGPAHRLLQRALYFREGQHNPFRLQLGVQPP